MEPYELPRKYIRAYCPCSSCGGSGMALNCYNGEPEDCRDCRGDGVERARDERGRFVGHRP